MGAGFMLALRENRFLSQAFQSLMSFMSFFTGSFVGCERPGGLAFCFDQMVECSTSRSPADGNSEALLMLFCFKIFNINEIIFL